MRRLASLLLVLGACDAVFRFNDVPLPVDAPVPQPDASCSFSRLFDTCQLGDPSTWQNDVAITADSQSDVFTKIDNVDVSYTTLHVVKVKSLGLLGGINLNLIGNKSFVIVSDADVTLEGTVRGLAGSRDASDCGLATGSPGLGSAGGAGGGGGGAYGGMGGTGGLGDKDGSASGVLPGAGGTTPAVTGELLGGCPGGVGGGGAGGSGGSSGGGGGAIAIISRTAIHVSAGALLNAAGGPGGGGQGGAMYSTGGGGGGAGGMWWLEAPIITIDGVVAANGGGGGEGGAGGGNGHVGSPGTTDDTAAAAGAGNQSGGGDGGSGAHLSHPDGYAATDWVNGGGGGGGGGVGIIMMIGDVTINGTTTPQLSPAP